MSRLVDTDWRQESPEERKKENDGMETVAPGDGDDECSCVRSLKFNVFDHKKTNKGPFIGAFLCLFHFVVTDS